MTNYFNKNRTFRYTPVNISSEGLNDPQEFSMETPSIAKSAQDSRSLGYFLRPDPHHPADRMRAENQDTENLKFEKLRGPAPAPQKYKAESESELSPFHASDFNTDSEAEQKMNRYSLILPSDNYEADSGSDLSPVHASEFDTDYEAKQEIKRSKKAKSQHIKNRKFENHYNPILSYDNYEADSGSDLSPFHASEFDTDYEAKQEIKRLKKAKSQQNKKFEKRYSPILPHDNYEADSGSDLPPAHASEFDTDYEAKQEMKRYTKTKIQDIPNKKVGKRYGPASPNYEYEADSGSDLSPAHASEFDTDYEAKQEMKRFKKAKSQNVANKKVKRSYGPALPNYKYEAESESELSPVHASDFDTDSDAERETRRMLKSKNRVAENSRFGKRRSPALPIHKPDSKSELSSDDTLDFDTDFDAERESKQMVKTSTKEERKVESEQSGRLRIIRPYLAIQNRS